MNKLLKAWHFYSEARQTKIWFPKPNPKKSLLPLRWIEVIISGHSKLKRYKNSLCLEEEESSFHVIAECPSMQIHRSECLPKETLRKTN